MSSRPELIDRTACAIVDALRQGEITTLDLLDALEARIAAVDPGVNALPTLCFDRARDCARRLMDKPAGERGRLAGMPLPIKDLTEVEGVRTTHGSPIYADHIPARSNILVQNIEAEGGVVYGKSAVPEFGAGGNTFNEVFGATLNPWNRSRSASGSSGGAAVALATGMAWVAHGNDMGGSLRNPASFCGIVGLRPTPGRVARDPGTLVDNLLAADGPMARNVADTGLLLDAMCGENPADPRSLPRLSLSYREHASQPRMPRRIAFSADLGITPVDPEVAAICRAAAEKLAGDGVLVEETHPDLSEAHEAFQTLRAFHFAASHAQKLRDFPELLKPEMVWNVEKGLKLTAAEHLKAEEQRAEMVARTVAFFDDFDLLLTPATIVPPFPIENRYVERCAGHEFETYIDWLAIAYAITLTTAPALSMPCGFTAEGLPVGLQVVARPRAEHDLLSYAAFIESELDATITTPIDPR
ncbi:amidase [Frigidibacter sp. ROC022]|uniref:amidase n=1 Tax=Frigidibacter sp. ROC022 TaxID=2971796 RepID=UPI00215B1BA5|nr:amidase family protein [Frigidibacter sp. ROC022]MCR8722702.1 amidase family protein [Frigidibacter sp. ROC022]